MISFTFFMPMCFTPKESIKCSSLFDICLIKWGKYEKPNKVKAFIKRKKYLGILKWKVLIVIRKTWDSNGWMSDQKVSRKLHAIQSELNN